MKIKTFSDDLLDRLDTDVNAFIKHKHVIDIKFSTSISNPQIAPCYGVLIMYEDMGIKGAWLDFCSSIFDFNSKE